MSWSILRSWANSHRVCWLALGAVVAGLFLGGCASSDEGSVPAAVASAPPPPLPLPANKVFPGSGSGHPGGDIPGIVTEHADDYRIVRVFYGTDRARTDSLEAAERYSGARGALEYGTLLVSIPDRHVPGALEAPSLWRLEVSEDPSQHVVLMRVTPREKADFFRLLENTRQESGRKDLFVFVHGFNVSFEDGARRTAQLNHDLGFPGVPVFYSWPSDGSLSPLAYTADRNDAEWSAAHLEAFLEALYARSGQADIHLVAHSMGNYVTLTALRNIALRRSDFHLATLVLAAPDFDTGLFERDIAPLLPAVSAKTILYASSEDRALQVSREIWAAPRLGDSTDYLCVASGLETIDASGVDLSQLGHSYIGSTAEVLRDLGLALIRRLLPPERDLLERERNTLVYWALPTDGRDQGSR